MNKSSSLMAVASIAGLATLPAPEISQREQRLVTALERRQAEKKKIHSREIKRCRKQRPYRVFGKKQSKPASSV